MMYGCRCGNPAFGVNRSSMPERSPTFVTASVSQNLERIMDWYLSARGARFGKVFGR